MEITVRESIPKWTLVVFSLVVACNLKPILQVHSSRLSQLRRDEGGESQKSCHMRELELCSVGALSIFQNPNGLPSTQVELTRQCEYLNESVTCFEDYTQHCLTDSLSKLVGMFAGSAAKVAGDFCNLDSDLRRNYTRHIGCFRDVQREHQRPCLSDFQKAFESIHKMNHTQRMPLICCNINRLKECIFVPIEYECGIAASATIDQLLGALFGSVYHLPCRNYNSTNDKCLELLPKIGLKPHTGRNTSALSRVVSGFTNVPAQV